MPIDRGAIDQQLRDLREGEHWWEVREFRELPHLMYADERIHGVIRGHVLGRLPKVRPTRRWLIVATNQRVIFLKHTPFGLRQIEVMPAGVTRVYHSNRLRGYQISIVTTVQKVRVRIRKADAFRFVQALAAVIPSESVHRLSPGLEALSWVPGISAVAELPGVERMLSKATSTVMTAPTAPASRSEMHRLEDTVEQLQKDVDRLIEQVAFLEDLLQKRAETDYSASLPEFNQ
jgi:hypothetical protein